MGQAVGDALGVPYEFGVRALTGTPQLLGGIAPGRWSDDTEMAVSIAEVAAAGADLRTDDAQQRIAQDLLRWYQDGPPGIGAQTRAVPAPALQRSGPAAMPMRSVSRTCTPAPAGRQRLAHAHRSSGARPPRRQSTRWSRRPS